MKSTIFSNTLREKFKNGYNIIFLSACKMGPTDKPYCVSYPTPPHYKINMIVPSCLQFVFILVSYTKMLKFIKTTKYCTFLLFLTLLCLYEAWCWSIYSIETRSLTISNNIKNCVLTESVLVPNETEFNKMELPSALFSNLSVVIHTDTFKPNFRSSILVCGDNVILG